MTNKPVIPGSSLEIYYDSILGDISKLIDAARSSAARSVNCIMTAAYWGLLTIGKLSYVKAECQ